MRDISLAFDIACSFLIDSITPKALDFIILAFDVVNDTQAVSDLADFVDYWVFGYVHNKSQLKWRPGRA